MKRLLRFRSGNRESMVIHVLARVIEYPGAYNDSKRRA